jgi:hypothetical protein
MENYSDNLHQLVSPTPPEISVDPKYVDACHYSLERIIHSMLTTRVVLHLKALSPGFGVNDWELVTAQSDLRFAAADVPLGSGRGPLATLTSQAQPHGVLIDSERRVCSSESSGTESPQSRPSP